MPVYPLLPTIQNYAWGGYEFIPTILGIQDYDKSRPFAELWMGAHPKSPSFIKKDGRPVLLSRWIKENADKSLGKTTRKKFGDQLPFLFKVLDVKKMLSIQIHPSKAVAEAGFAKENKKGIPFTAFNRNYKDDNHKPEIMLALSDFWLLHGFKSKGEIAETLGKTREFALLARRFQENKNLHDLYEFIMKMPQKDINRLLKPLKARLQRAPSLDKKEPDFWAIKAFEDYIQEGNYDRGIFSIYLFNLLKLQKGEVIYQGSGLPHAYLEGANVELMANSDNVFRGGLTSKYIDIEELLSNTSCKPVVPKILKGKKIKDQWTAFKTPAADFELSQLAISEKNPLEIPAQLGPAIYWISEGTIQVNDQLFKQGKSFWVDDSSAITITGKGIIFRAGMPISPPKSRLLLRQ